MIKPPYGVVISKSNKNRIKGLIFNLVPRMFENLYFISYFYFLT